MIFLNRLTGVILGLTVLMWFLSTFRGAPEGATQPATEYSFAGYIGRALQSVFAPIGFNRQIRLALISSFAEREPAVEAPLTVHQVRGEANGRSQVVGEIGS